MCFPLPSTGEQHSAVWGRVFTLFLAALMMLVIPGQLPAQTKDSLSLVGAGSTVPLPLYIKWSQEFNRLHRGVEMQYQPLGTSEGLKLISGSKDELGKTDFSAGEVLLTAQERSAGNLVELPAVIIGIVPIYNLPGVSQELKFSGELLAQIFMGKVKTWNAPQLARLNPGVNLPSLPIKVINRPAGKGSNYVFTDFLSKNSAEFRGAIGRSASPSWPVGTPAGRSSDMVDMVMKDRGTIGYVELQYAQKGDVQHGLVQNPAGKFVKASDRSITAACQAVEAPQWNQFAASLTNAPGADSYPIASFSWLYVRSVSNDSRRRAALVNFLTWAYSGGQKLADQEGYSELPSELLAKVQAKVNLLQ